MAHLAKLGALSEELVILLTSTTPRSDSKAFNIYKESALRQLRYSTFPRTNQFDIVSRLDGLEEKFRVYNEDPLADALRERLDKLNKLDVKWTPEILHLLLELSDRPLANSRLEDLEFLGEREKEKEPLLHWSDLAKTDPLLREKSVWQNVDFGAESVSDEDRFDDGRSDISGTDDTVQSSLDEDIQRRPEDHAVVVGSKEELAKLRDAQFWNKMPSVAGVKLETVKKTITELQAIREVLFMLGGYPTSLFDYDTDSGINRPLKTFALKHASEEAYLKLMESFTDHGSAINHLRLWTKRPQSTPLIQVFQDEIQSRLSNFDVLLSKISTRYLAPQQDVVVSLLVVQDEIVALARPLSCLADLLADLETDRNRHAFRYLEMLFDRTGTAHMAGDDAMYSFMGKIFFKCFQVYLRPIRVWMEDGELAPGDKVFFVSETSGDAELAQLWKSRFKIRRNQNGALHVPKFLHAAASRIFTTGKSVVVLKHLNQFHLSQHSKSTVEPLLDFGTVCNPMKSQLAPFGELFEIAFNRWVQSKHHRVSSTLRKLLFDSCGLHTSLDALSHIYFLADGTAGAAFASTIFDKLDTLNPSWNDRFTLTELAQSTLGSISSVSADRLRTSVQSLANHHDVARCRKTVKILAIVELRYKLSWPIQIIVTPDTITAYQRVFTFLLQIRRSSHILSRQRLLTDDLTNTSSSDESALYYSLRVRLVWFTQTLYYYLTSLVLEPNSQKMQTDLETAEDVDMMIEVHSNFMKSTIDQALLGSRLAPIQKTILNVLNLAIKLEDAQAANAAASKETAESQQEMMNMSMASLGLHRITRSTPMANFRRSVRAKPLESSEDEDEVADVDLSILSVQQDDAEGDLSYVEKLRTMKADFDRLVRFVAGGLKGVARAGGGEEGKCWDILGEMLENGLDPRSKGY